MEANGTSSKGKEPATNPTPTPRLSFGVEIECLVATLIDEDGPDPDAEISHLLPPVYPFLTTESRVREIFSNYGIPAQPESLHDRSHSRGWGIASDPSVQEVSQDYIWTSLELQSPSCYAMDEALDMIKLVTTIIKRNLRCRVNESCGLHVHVGNGHDRLDSRTIRNFSALWYSAEPILSMLHPPERAFSTFSVSSRRVRESRLSCNQGAEDIRKSLAGHPIPTASAVNYHGRDRRLGETPAAEQFYGSALGWWGVTEAQDDTDWAGKGTRPFQRNRYQPEGRPVTNEMLMNPGAFSLKKGPPEIPPRPTEEKGGQEMLWLREKERYEGNATPSSSTDPSKTVGTWLKPIRDLLLPRLTPRSDNYRPVEKEKEGLCPERTARITKGGPAMKQPWRQDAWSGVAELLACDAGSHACAELLTDDSNFRGFNLNTTHYSAREIIRSIRFPDSELSEEGREARKGRQAKFPEETGVGLTTLEFREAAGSLDGVWIVTWARILVGLVEFARDADPAELMRVIALCAEATESPDSQQEGNFDVVDLLQATGLYAEAIHAERRLGRQNEAFFECLLTRPDYSFPSSPNYVEELALSSRRSSGMTKLLEKAEEAVAEVEQGEPDWLFKTGSRPPSRASSQEDDREARDLDD